jgi:hypothetical protein
LLLSKWKTGDDGQGPSRVPGGEDGSDDDDGDDDGDYS